MNIRLSSIQSVFLAALLTALLLPASYAASPPNILILLADDMGWGDLGHTGSKQLRTPHLDQLATNGVFCSQAYVASSVCAPSRAGLMTGRQPSAIGFEANLAKWDEKSPTRELHQGLHPKHRTMADHLRDAGYATALVGKWHLGYAEEHHPNRRGFDHFCGMISGSHGYFPLEQKRHSIERNGSPVTAFSNPYLTDFFTDEIMTWIGEVDKDQPWFCFGSYNAPHTPMHATEADLADFAHIADRKRRTYAAMMQALDRGVGRIVAQLKSIGELDNTLIVFFSDNGGATTNASWNGPFSGCKGNMREGGIRTPMIFHWPAGLPRSHEVKTPVSSLDLLATFLAAAGAKSPDATDGANLLPVLRQETDTLDRPLFWRLQGQACVLHSEGKLIRLSHRPAQLFRLQKDQGEQNDLAATERETLLQLFSELSAWEAGLPTYPHFYSAPMWQGHSAKNYDSYLPRAE